ncbi:unnamed protein product [Trichobilharzia szidati]|nr:unnamed protein product [Trichobilharzia szidati]
MTLLTETTYAFINNNLQEKSISKPNSTKYEVVPDETKEYLHNETVAQFAKQQQPNKGPSERKLNSSRNYFLRTRNARSNCGDDIQLRHFRSYTPDSHASNKNSFQRNTSFPPSSSQSSSSSSRQLSPTTTPRAPLLGTNHKRYLSKSKMFKDNLRPDYVSSDQTQIFQDRFDDNRQTKPNAYIYSCSNLTNKLQSPPIYNLKMKARRVWNVFERKINNGRGMSQSKSVGNLQCTSSSLRGSDYYIRSNKTHGISCTQTNIPGTEKKNEYLRNNRSDTEYKKIMTFPHSKSFDTSVNLDDKGKLHQSSYITNTPVNAEVCAENHHSEKCTDKYCGMEKFSYILTPCIMHPNAIPNNPTQCGDDDFIRKLSGIVISKCMLQNHFLERCNGSHTDHRECQPLKNSSESPVYILPTGLPIQEVREITITRPDIGQRFGMRIEKFEKGAFLTTVLPGSVAAQAGLKIGDEILQLNGVSVQPISINSINQLIRSTQYHLNIAYRPRTMLAKIRYISVKKIDGRVGIRLKRVAQGLYVDVVLPNSAASKAGIKEGDELVCVNNQVVTSWSQEAASKLLRELPDDDFVLLHLRELLHPHAFYDPVQLNGHVINSPLRECYSTTCYSTLKSNLSTDDFRKYKTMNTDQSYSPVKSSNKVPVNNPEKQSLPPTYHEVVNQTLCSNSNSYDVKSLSERPNTEYSQMSLGSSNNDERCEILPFMSHTRILNSFSDYSLGCSKCLMNDQQIQ